MKTINNTRELLEILSRNGITVNIEQDTVYVYRRRVRRFLFFQFEQMEHVDTYRLGFEMKSYDYIDEYFSYVSSEIKNNRSGDRPILDLLNMCVGNSVESSEVLSLLQKYVYFGRKYQKYELVDELSDELFYFFGIMSIIGTSLEEIIRANVAKLKSRYPNGRRDLNVFKDKEREAEIVREIVKDNDLRI